MFGFKLHPIDDDSLPVLESHLAEDGFPQTASGAFVYFKCRNKNVKLDEAASVTTSVTPSGPKKFDDDADYTGPVRLQGTIKISAKCNVKTRIKDLALDFEDSGITLRWALEVLFKFWQQQCLALSSTQLTMTLFQF